MVRPDSRQSSIRAIPVGAETLGVAFTPGGDKAYVTNFGAGSVSVIEAATNRVATVIVVGTGPCGIGLTPDGSEAYVVNQGAGTVSVIDTATDMVTATITTGGDPQSFGTFVR